VVLPAKDIEHYLFKNGYGGVIRRASGSATRSAGKAIRGAVDRVSKPGLALEILAEADRRGPEGVPPVIRDVAETARRLARG
jgi:putative ATP-dependent endonuclease of OLD family